MCEILVRINDKAPGVPGASIAGDVIAVAGDGHPWSSGELAHPDWQVVRLPGLPSAVMETYLESSQAVGGRVLHKRAIGFDMSDVLGMILRGASSPVTFGAAAAAELFARSSQRTAEGVE